MQMQMQMQKQPIRSEVLLYVVCYLLIDCIFLTGLRKNRSFMQLGASSEVDVHRQLYHLQTALAGTPITLDDP